MLYLSIFFMVYKDCCKNSTMQDPIAKASTKGFERKDKEKNLHGTQHNKEKEKYTKTTKC